MWAVDDTGRYSVNPSTMAMMIALIKSISYKGFASSVRQSIKFFYYYFLFKIA